jgi:hypothetical protein
MSAIEETIGALRDIVRLSAHVERRGALLSELARELREHDKRLARLDNTHRDHADPRRTRPITQPRGVICAAVEARGPLTPLTAAADAPTSAEA